MFYKLYQKKEKKTMARLGDHQSEHVDSPSSAERSAHHYNPCYSKEAYNYLENYARDVIADSDHFNYADSDPSNDLGLRMQAGGGGGGGDNPYWQWHNNYVRQYGVLPPGSPYEQGGQYGSSYIAGGDSSSSVQPSDQQQGQYGQAPTPQQYGQAVTPASDYGGAPAASDYGGAPAASAGLERQPPSRKQQRMQFLQSLRKVDKKNPLREQDPDTYAIFNREKGTEPLQPADMAEIYGELDELGIHDKERKRMLTKLLWYQPPQGDDSSQQQTTSASGDASAASTNREQQKAWRKEARMRFLGALRYAKDHTEMSWVDPGTYAIFNKETGTRPLQSEELAEIRGDLDDLGIKDKDRERLLNRLRHFFPDRR
jgi:hypothetical protein